MAPFVLCKTIVNVVFMADLLFHEILSFEVIFRGCRALSSGLHYSIVVYFIPK